MSQRNREMFQRFRGNIPRNLWNILPGGKNRLIAGVFVRADNIAVAGADD